MFIFRVLSVARTRTNPDEVHMNVATTPQSSGSLSEALERRQREGKPVRIGLIGAGQMGTDIIVQTALMQGIDVVAAADAIAENVVAARQIAGDGARTPEFVQGASATDSAIKRGRLAVTSSFRDVCTA